MSSSRWNSQWKKHGQAGPSPFAATPSHRNQWQAQLGKLKQKAAFRRAKQQAEQHAQPSETQPRSAGKSANRSDGVDNVHQESHQQAGQQQQTSTGGAVDDSADSDKFMQQAQSRSDQQNIGTISAPSPCSEQLPQHERSSTTQQECDTVSCQETTDADHSVKGAHQKKYSDTLNELRSSHSEQADASQCLHHEGTGSDCMEPVHKAGNGSAHQPVWDASIGAVHDTTNGHNTEESADAANGPGSYSYASEDSSHTATEKVQSQLLGLRRRAARKAAA